MDMVEIIAEELARWELIRSDAIGQYNRASIAIEALKELTDKMRELAEHGRPPAPEAD